MRSKATIAAALLIAMAAGAMAQEGSQNKALRFTLTTAQVGYAVLNGLDFGMSYVALKNESIFEANPSTASLVRNPLAGTAWTLATSAGFILASNFLYKRNRTLGTILAVAGLAFKAWVVVHNFKTIDSLGAWK